jgi:hypothetical protein
MAVAAVLVVGPTGALSRPALACGGLFCDGPGTGPSPTVTVPPAQSGERIVFVLNREGWTLPPEGLVSGGAIDGGAGDGAAADGGAADAGGVDADGGVGDGGSVDAGEVDAAGADAEAPPPIVPASVDAYIEIAYSGAAPNFAWIVPLTAPPMLIGTADPALFDLDAATAPSFTFSYQLPFTPSPGGGCRGGCFLGGADAAPEEGGGPQTQEIPPVTVISQQSVGPYDVAVLTSEKASALTDWLQANGYRIPDFAESILSTYVEEGKYFAAFKLHDGEGTGAIRPVVLRIPGMEPCIPLRMTPVPSEPIVSVTAFVFGNGRAHTAADSGYSEATVDMLSVRPTSRATTDYPDRLRAAVKELRGRGFVTELATSSDGLAVLAGGSLAAPLAAIAGRTTFLTRLTTRIAPDEMTADPAFLVDAFDQTVVTNQFAIDLTGDQAAINALGQPPADGQVLGVSTLSAGPGAPAACAVASPRRPQRSWGDAGLPVGVLVALVGLLLGRRRARRKWAAGMVVGALVLTGWVGPGIRPALACGGLFCDGANPMVTVPPAQSAERIVFVLNNPGWTLPPEGLLDGVTIDGGAGDAGPVDAGADAGADASADAGVDGGEAPPPPLVPASVDAYIEIGYSGAAPSFSWVVPLTAAPTLIGTANKAIFDVDGATAPRFTFTYQQAFPASGGGGGCQIGCAGKAGEDSDGGGALAPSIPEVTVISQQSVGPYDVAVLTSEKASALTDWLQANKYRIPDFAEPILARYVEEGKIFAAFKLQDGVGVGAIQPVVLRVPGADPCIPLRMTPVASQPVLSVTALVYAAGRARPGVNTGYSEATVDMSAVLPTSPSTTDYPQRLRTAVKALRGRGFVTEFAGYSQQGFSFGATAAPLQAIAQRVPFLTRLSTRIAPEEMTADPGFTVDPGDQTEVTNHFTIDLTGNQAAIDTLNGVNTSGQALTMPASGGATSCAIAPRPARRGWRWGDASLPAGLAVALLALLLGRRRAAILRGHVDPRDLERQHRQLHPAPARRAPRADPLPPPR